MKIAFVTDNGKSISPCYGQALYFLVLTVEDGEIIDQELRDKYTVANHPMLIDPITDCDILICGGMEQVTYDALVAKDVKPIVTDLELVGPALHALLEDTLIHQTALVQ